MNIRLYSYFDRKARTFSMPQAETNDECAKRTLAHFINSSPLGKLVGKDLELFYIGDFNQASGYLLTLESPQFICEASDLVLGDVLENEA